MPASRSLVRSSVVSILLGLSLVVPAAAQTPVNLKAAESAVKIFSALDAPYNLARAYNYEALIAGMQDRRADAAAA